MDNYFQRCSVYHEVMRDDENPSLPIGPEIQPEELQHDPVLGRECSKHKADDEVSFTVVRDRKDQEIIVKFGNYPKGGRSPFTGTLGGQSAGSHPGRAGGSRGSGPGTRADDRRR